MKVFYIAFAPTCELCTKIKVCSESLYLYCQILGVASAASAHVYAKLGEFFVETYPADTLLLIRGKADQYRYILAINNLNSRSDLKLRRATWQS
jgi:hypothetical protein